jgi:ribosomal protein S18 acetylase RimI-like enzyme
MQIVRAETVDLEGVLRIARAVQLPQTSSAPPSFLMSNYDLKWYENILTVSEVAPDRIKFLVARSDEQVVGFLVAYDTQYIREHVQGISEKAILKWLNDTDQNERFWVIKQVAVDLQRQRIGAGRAMTRTFLEMVSCTYVFAAIVADPRNAPSEGLHESMGFKKLLASASVDSVSGHSYPNNVWCRDMRAATAKLKKRSTKFP